MVLSLFFYFIFFILICAGWWPEYSIHSYPSWCNKTRYNEFNLTKLKKLLPIMKKVWYSCPEWKGTNNVQFWKHEWDKHGTCIHKDSLFDFFNHAILAYLKTQRDNWYGCCFPHDTECLIPFSKNVTKIKWLGWCHSK